MRTSDPTPTTGPARRDGAISFWFGLTYSHYLVLHRSLMQEMPHEWQDRMVALLKELEEAWDVERIPSKFTVQMRDEAGRFVRDRFAEYRHPDIELIESVRRTR